jgi:glycosyltransferase involved in cell wall biosynthesis
MRISLIVTTYDRPDALSLVFKSIESQIIKPFEVIIADDGSDERTSKVVENFKVKSNFKVVHSYQSDKGFRASRSRNKAIAKAEGDYIVLIDGDMILQSQFIKDHAINAKPGFFIQGSRVLLSEIITKSILKKRKIFFNFFSAGLRNRKNTIHSNILSLFFSKESNHLYGIKTCNLAFFREDCIRINGFNNNFEGWGREDSDFASRLMNIGIKRKSLKFNAIQYHLWHKENNRESLVDNDAILQMTIDRKVTWCDNGIDRFFL